MVLALDHPYFMEITFIKTRGLTLLAKECLGIKVIFPRSHCRAKNMGTGHHPT